jgi:hypothetical protein
MTCLLDENSPHRFSSRGEEVAAAVPLWSLLGVDKSNVDFMNEGRGLQRLTGLFPREFPRRKLPQFVVDQWQQFFGGPSAASVDHLQDASDVPHCIPPS